RPRRAGRPLGRRVQGGRSHQRRPRGGDGRRRRRCRPGEARTVPPRQRAGDRRSRRAHHDPPGPRGRDERAVPPRDHRAGPGARARAHRGGAMSSPPRTLIARRRRHLAVVALLALLVTACQLESDDFDAPELGDRWAVVDPKGDGEVSLGTAPDGSGTLDLTVPAGTSHDPWVPNEALRVVQAVKDEDTAIEAKFLSVPTTPYQIEGLMFLEDADTFLRFEYHANNAGLRAYAAFV